MKKILLGVFTTFVIILLTGCGKDSPSVALCKKMTPQMEKYESGEITYKEFLDTIKPYYDKYCSKDPETICTFVSGMYFSEQTDLEIRDCSMYNDETGKSFKEACEISNETNDKYCSKDPETICTFVSGMYFSEQTDLEIRDCSMYNDETGKSFKEACEISNETRRTIATNKEKIEKNSISLLKKDCSVVK